MPTQTSALVLDAYGQWIASLRPWNWFVTLTHDENRKDAPRFVGAALHRRKVREWFHEDVRPFCESAGWWSELEFHLSGWPHEHAVLHLPDNAPWKKMRTAWWDRAGYATWLPIDARGAESPAAYITKYSQKATSREPLVWGIEAMGPKRALQQVVPPAWGDDRERRWHFDPARVIEENER